MATGDKEHTRATLEAALECIVVRENGGPAFTLERLNRFVVDTVHLDSAHRGTTYVSLALVVDTRTDDATFSSAGAEPPVLLRARSDEAIELLAGRPLLGALDTAQYEIGRTTMETGDLLAITTDGIAEARRARTSSFFGLDGLVGAVRDTWNHESLAGIGQAVAERAQQFGGGALKDDVCLLLARRREPENGA